MVHRSGWKAIGALYAQGQLAGDYDSSEKPEITIWYTRNAARRTQEEHDFCASKPEYVLMPDDLVDIHGAPATDRHQAMT